MSAMMQPEISGPHNAMVASHVGLLRSAVGVVASYARGDFEADLPPLPGKKRFVNESLDQIRDLVVDLDAEAATERALRAAAELHHMISPSCRGKNVSASRSSSQKESKSC